MEKPHPIELRERAVALVEQGHTHTEAGRRLAPPMLSPIAAPAKARRMEAMSGLSFGGVRKTEGESNPPLPGLRQMFPDHAGASHCQNGHTAAERVLAPKSVDVEIRNVELLNVRDGG